ncbi:hypothetical protein COHA_002486 [Chlorella ohadii]|uniref:Protein kinase domain-containing protein n=1 Tax=Chlorella ohadii TaxID=2649997 RepID=A0AAD5H7J9_9CHLO|nr:hypothetical protein COHA_002486 [Chlorella ohadii]
MHLRSAQKRLLAAEAAARTNSGVGSSQQLDRTDSCGGSADADAGLTTAAAAAADTAAGAAQQPPEAQQSWQQAQVQQSQRIAAVAGAAAAAAAARPEQPPTKRRRISRAGVPAPLPSYELRTFDRPSPPFRDDDENGHYRFEIGENLAPRFKIMRKFGEGTFGQVLECWDRKRRDYVAVKIIRNIQKYRDAAMIELEALHTLAANDPSQAQHCVRLMEWFDYRGHVCMVFERLGPSLYDFLRRNAYRPFPLAMAQAFARQLLESVAFMHELQLVHTDLKPENILVLNNEVCKDPPPSAKVGKRLPASSVIRVIDFGSATFNSDYHSTIVSTRHYRAPEVILGLGWSFPCDIWSVGCILVELLSGDALFQTHENLEHLAMMEAVLGPIPPQLASSAAEGVRDLFRRNRLNWPDGAESKKSLKAVQRLKKLKEYLKQHCEDAVRPHLDCVADLIRRMLEYRASERITAAEALRHPFFALQF